MKILSRKEQDEILKRVSACQIIANKYIDDMDEFDKMTNNLAYVSISIGGCSGANRVMNTVHKYNEEVHE